MTLSSSQVTAASAPIILDGEEYQASPLTDKNLSEFDEWLRSEVMHIAYSNLPGSPGDDQFKEIRKEIIDSALKSASTISWTTPEGSMILQTPRGVGRVLWLMLKKNHPTIKPEQVVQFMHNVENLQRAAEIFKSLNSGLFGEEESQGKNEESSQ